MKKYLPILFAFILLPSFLFLNACNKGSDETIVTGEQAEKMGDSIKGDVDLDICKQFDADFIYSATGKPIVKVQPPVIAGIFVCRYYTDYKEDYFKDDETGEALPGGPTITIVLDNLNVADQKRGLETLGATLHEDSRIPMEHYIVRRSKDKTIWEIALVINPNRFVWVDQANSALTEEELINLAIRMAERIQDKETLTIQKNPAAASDTQAATTEPAADSAGGQKGLVETFLRYLADGKIDEALRMMDADDDTKQAWGVNFNSLKSLTVKSIEPVYQEEWTADREVYKATLDVQAKEETYGWYNGENMRWISVQKQGDVWMVHELANNP